MEPIKGLAQPKKAVEKITDVGPDGETFTADYEITLLFREMHRSEYLRIVRALKLEQSCEVDISFEQMELPIQDGGGEEWRMPS